mmetsp:Transcript_123785/g.214604  ORF Transcript_123785/g.214604 Transcript_123785/m.214604 type:complete len:236 (-) Transcript_123785:3-710(-)
MDDSPDRPPARLRGGSPTDDGGYGHKRDRSPSPQYPRKRPERNEDRTYGNYGQMAGTRGADRGRRPRRGGRNYTQQELLEYERMQPRKQVITDFDAPENAEDAPVIQPKANPFGSSNIVRRETSPIVDRMSITKRAPPMAAARPVEAPYLGLDDADQEDLEMAARRRERRPKDMKERLLFARDRAAELVKRKRLLQQIRELEDTIGLPTIEGVVTVGEDYLQKVEDAYALAKSFD